MLVLTLVLMLLGEEEEREEVDEGGAVRRGRGEGEGKEREREEPEEEEVRELAKLILRLLLLSDLLLTVPTLGWRGRNGGLGEVEGDWEGEVCECEAERGGRDEPEKELAAEAEFKTKVRKGLEVEMCDVELAEIELLILLR